MSGGIQSLTLLQRLAKNKTPEALEQALAKHRWRLNEHELAGATKIFIRNQCRAAEPNLSITLTQPLPDANEPKFDPVFGQGDAINAIAATKLMHKVEDFIYRLGRIVSQGALSKSNPAEWFKFFGFFECEASDGSGIAPSHYHCLVALPPEMLKVTGDGSVARNIWFALMRSNKADLIDQRPVDNDGIVLYSAKYTEHHYGLRFLVTNQSHRFLIQR